METVFAKPVSPDLVVRHPDTGKRLDPEGETVIRSSFWLRRELDGNVELSEPPHERQPAAKDKTKGKPAAQPAEKEV